jgi:hypothetical protein
MSSGPGQIVVFRGAQEAEAVGQALEHALGEDQAVLFRLGAQDLENQLLLAHAGGSGDGSSLAILARSVMFLSFSSARLMLIDFFPSQA